MQSYWVLMLDVFRYKNTTTIYDLSKAMSVGVLYRIDKIVVPYIKRDNRNIGNFAEL